MRPRRGLIVIAALALASMGGCLALSSAPGSVSPQERSRRALDALRREAFALARYDLLQLASDCRSGRYGREALLHLATAELDTGNPNGSPRLAAHVAARYLMLPDASPERMPLARSLYRLGADLGALTGPGDEEPRLPKLAPRFDTCEALSITASLPDPPPARSPTAARLAALQGELARLQEDLVARTDSLDLLRAELTSTTDSVTRLRAEIERIRALLRSGTPGHQPPGRR